MIEVVQRPAHSGNYQLTRFGRPVERIVIHLMAGSLEGTAAWFANPTSRVSAHYGVGADGRVHQYVPEQHTAWHAGVLEVNHRSVGIEHEGDHRGSEAWVPTAAQFEASARLAAEVCSRWGIEPSLESIVPHSAVSSRKPHCPGPGFDFEAYVSRVRELLAPAQPAVVPVRLFDPARNVQIGEGSAISGTDKVYVKRMGPMLVGASGGGGTAVRQFQFFKAIFEALWVRGGIGGKATFVVLALGLVVLLVLVLSGRAFAQDVNVLDPSTWFADAAAVIAVAGVIAGWVTKLATALGKDWFRTEGTGTVVLSGVIAVLVGGYGGYKALGMFAEQGGLQGAFSAAVIVLMAFLGSNASAKVDRQALAGAARRLEVSDEAATKARLL